MIKLTASAAYQRALDNPQSIGRRHNAELDSLLRRVKLERTRLGGRRLTKAQLCEVIVAYTADNASYSTFRVPALKSAAKQREAAGHTCDLSTGISRATTRLVSGGRSARNESEDWLDTLFATPSEWDEPDDSDEELPSVAEDAATVAVLTNLLVPALENSTSLAQAQAAVASIVSSMDTASAGTAMLIGEAAALATSSAEYWTENIDEWAEQFCENEPPEHGADVGSANIIEEICENEGQGPSVALTGPRATRDIDWKTVGKFAGADLIGMLGPLGMIYSAYEALQPSYKKVVGVWREVDVDGTKALVRTMMEVDDHVPMTAVAKHLGAKAGRFLMFSGGVVGAVAGSALSLM